MEQNELSVSDELFYKLISLESALKTSVAQPISIPSSIPSYGDKLHIYSLMYFDCEDRGEEIMENRIKLYPNDIRNAILYHEIFLEKFDKIKTGVLDNNRENIGEEVEGLSVKLSDYLDLIKLHQVNTKPNHFLYFPTCMPGHFIVNRGLIRELNFNYEQEEHSARKELREMLETKELFKRNAVDIPTQAFSPPLLDLLTSEEYKFNIGITRRLLKNKLNFSV